MKRSVQVSTPLLAASALSLLTGCRHQPEMQRCVDEKNQVVADSFCKNPAGQQQMRNNSGGFFYPYRYYYGGGGGFGLGSSVYGGGYNAIGGHSYAAPGSSSSTSRGGFGSTHGGESGSGGGGE
jgi:hypothetical protein